jgi:hypothetical protein
MLVKVAIAELDRVKRFVEADFLGWCHFVLRGRGIKGAKFVVWDLERLGARFSDQTIDAATLEASLCLLALIGNAANDGSLLEGVILGLSQSG